MSKKDVKKLIIEAEDYSVRGMDLEEILEKHFWNEMKKEFPTVKFNHIVFSLDNSDSIMLGYEKKKGKLFQDRFIVASTPRQYAKKIIEILKRC